jgi:hypothetical protein
MPFYRKLSIVLTNTLFRLLLFFTISIVAAVFLYTDRNYIPNVLERNSAYERIVGALLETNKEQSLTTNSDVTLQDPRVQQIITDAFPADELRRHTSNVISSTYTWLEQDSSALSFTIDLTKNKERLATGLSSFAVDRLQQLPVCTNYTLETDPFSATCQPTAMDFEAERLKLEYQLRNEESFLKNTVITEETIFGNNQETPFNEQYRHYPTYFSVITQLPIYIYLVLIILATIVIFASSTRKIGMRKIGRSLIGSASSLIFFTIVFSFILPQFTGSLPIFNSSGKGVDALLNEIAIDFGRDYSLMIIKISLPLILIGLVMVLYAQSEKNKKNYSSAKLKSGVISSNEQKTKSENAKKIRPPIQSSESSDTKPKRKLKNKKYRKIPKKEL